MQGNKQIKKIDNGQTKVLSHSFKRLMIKEYWNLNGPKANLATPKTGSLN